MNLVTRELLSQVQNVRLQTRRKIRSHRRGEKNSLQKGSSLEFADYREYLQGDDIRSIDWSAYARSERLYLKLFFEEESKPVYFLVDGSESMDFGNPTKFHYAIAAATLLSYSALRRYDRPKILFIQDESFRTFEFPSQSQFFTACRLLEKLKPAGPTKLNTALRKIAMTNFSKGIFFLISDFYSTDGFETLKLLASRGHDLHCWHLLTDEEWNPGVRGDLKFVDSETDDRTEVTISPHVLKHYSKRLRQLQDEIKNTAHHCGATYFPINNSRPLAAFILRDLRKTGILL